MILLCFPTRLPGPAPVSTSAAQALARLYLFQGVPRDELAAFVAALPEVVVARGQALCRQGEPAAQAWLVVEGCLVARLEAGGGELVLGDVREGEVAGEAALFLPGGRHAATVLATETARCLLLDPAALDGLRDNRALLALERHLLGCLARRVRATNLHVRKAALRPGEGLGQRLRRLWEGA